MTDKELEKLARKERLEYFKEWRSKNKDKVKKHNQTYWLKKAKQRLEAAEHTNKN